MFLLYPACAWRTRELLYNNLPFICAKRTIDRQVICFLRLRRSLLLYFLFRTYARFFLIYFLVLLANAPFFCYNSFIMKISKDKLLIATFSSDAAETARAYSLGLEINHTCISEALDPPNRSALLAEIRRDIAKSGANIPQKLILHGPFTEIHPAAIDHRARELGMQRLNEAYEVAAALGVTRMVVHTGWLPFIYFKSWQAEKGAQFWQTFLADKPADLRIYVENVLEDEPYMLAEMMRQIEDPRVRLCLDVGHANAMTEKNLPVTEWIRILGPYLAHFHLHNNDGSSDRHAAFADGSMDMRKVLDTIAGCCARDVTFTIEAREPLPCLAWLEANHFL